MESSSWTNFIIFIVVLHFIVGFAYLIYKLSPRAGDEMPAKENDEPRDKIKT